MIDENLLCSSLPSKTEAAKTSSAMAYFILYSILLLHLQILSKNLLQTEFIAKDHGYHSTNTGLQDLIRQL